MTFFFADVDSCESSPCQNGATCVDEIDGYTCQCTDQWLGGNCTGNACCFEQFQLKWNDLLNKARKFFVAWRYLHKTRIRDGPLGQICLIFTCGVSAHSGKLHAYMSTYFCNTKSYLNSLLSDPGKRQRNSISNQFMVKLQENSVFYLLELCLLSGCCVCGGRAIMFLSVP